MADLGFTPEQHAQVTAAVAEAERTTDGEIVTIVTGQSDAYHDVGLHYAVAAMLLLAGLFVASPGIVEAKLAWFQGGWITRVELPQALFLTMVSQAVLFLIVRYALAWRPLRMALTPRATKARRVRRRAVQFFKAAAEKRTENRIGILLYLSLAERRAEIVADEAIHSKVPAERWGEAMAELVEGFRRGDAAAGMCGAVGKIAEVLREHFPKTHGDANEIPDWLIEL